MNHCFGICHYQQNVPQHYYLLDTLVLLTYLKDSNTAAHTVDSDIFQGSDSSIQIYVRVARLIYFFYLRIARLIFCPRRVLAQRPKPEEAP